MRKRARKGPNAINRVRLSCWLLCAHWKRVCCAIRAHAPIECILITSFEQIFFLLLLLRHPWVLFMFILTSTAVVVAFFPLLCCCFVRRHQYLKFNKLFKFFCCCWLVSSFMNNQRKQTLIPSNRLLWFDSARLCSVIGTRNQWLENSISFFSFDFELGWIRMMHKPTDCIVIAFTSMRLSSRIVRV